MAKVDNKSKGFNSVARGLVFDNALSDRARFIYVYMACKPEGWEFFQDKVAKELNIKKDTLRKYLDELIIRGWITEKEQQNEGKFGCLEYVIEIDRKKGNLPIRKNPNRIKPDTEKTRIGKNSNHINIDSISSDNDLSSDKKEIENKRLSDDNQKGCDVLNFEKYMKEHYPYIMKMDKPLTLNQATELKKDFGEEIVLEVFTAMDNYKPLLKKYRDAYRVARNWCERRAPEKKEVQI